MAIYTISADPLIFIQLKILYFVCNVIHHILIYGPKGMNWYFLLVPPLDLQQPQCPHKRAWSNTEKRVSWTSCSGKRRHKRRQLSLPSLSRFWRRQCGRRRRVRGSRWSSTRRRWSRQRREGPTRWLPTESRISCHAILRAKISDEIKIETIKGNLFWSLCNCKC